MTLLRALLVVLALALPAGAQEMGPLQTALQANRAEVERASRKSVDGVLEALAATGSPQLQAFLEAWRQKRVVQREADGLFFIGEREGDVYALTDIDTAEPAGEVGRREADEL